MDPKQLDEPHAQVGTTELARHLAEVLARAKMGRPLLIVRYGRPVAALVSPEDAAVLRLLKELDDEE